MQTYSIDQFAQITGLNKILIRTWENRYNFIVPNRTSTNIRTYDEHMLTKGIKYAILVNAGHKISKLIKFDNNEVNNLLNKTLNTTKNYNTKNAIYISKFIESALHLNQKIFSQTYKSCIAEYGFNEFYKEIIIPTMNRIGILFLNYKITPVHEHFISENIRIKIANEIEKTKSNPLKKSRTWVLFLPEHEYHDISLLFTYLILKQNNQKVIYIGQNTPIESLIEFNKHHNLLCFLNTKSSQSNLAKMNIFFEKEFQDSFLYIVTNQKQSLSQAKNIKHLHKIEELEKVLKA